MTLTISPLHPLFAAEVRGVDCGNLDEASFGRIRNALDQYAVLAFRDQAHLSDEAQVEFSRLFGDLEVTLKANPGVGTHFAKQTNLDTESGEVLSADDRRMLHQKANFLWHTDSSYKPVPSLCSLLLARLLPDEGGNTEFADMRAAWDALSFEKQEQLLGLEVHHSLQHSRNRVDPRALTDEMRAELPGAAHPLVRTNHVTGRKALFVGSHASHVIGWSREEGTALVEELNEFAGQARFVYSHFWLPGDMVLWDNRSVLHRATAYDAQKYKRMLQRTTVAGDAAEYGWERGLAQLAPQSMTA